MLKCSTSWKIKLIQPQPDQVVFGMPALMFDATEHNTKFNAVQRPAVAHNLLFFWLFVLSNHIWYDNDQLI